MEGPGWPIRAVFLFFSHKMTTNARRDLQLYREDENTCTTPPLQGKVLRSRAPALLV